MAAQIVSVSLQDKTVHERDGSLRDKLSSEESLSLEQDFTSNPFADPAVAAHYAAIYEKAQYECRHVVDPTLYWTAQEEKKIVRKLDWHVCLWAVSKQQTTQWLTSGGSPNMSCHRSA